MQAALGLSQIKRLDKCVTRRHEIAKYYDNELKSLPFITPRQASNVYSSYHLYPILIKNNSDSKTQRYIYDELRKNNIAANLHYIPVHRQPYYENLGFKKNDFPQAESFHRKVLSIPMYAILKDDQQKYVVETIAKVISE